MIATLVIGPISLRPQQKPAPFFALSLIVGSAVVGGSASALRS